MKDKQTAYLLWFFLGDMGFHHFYLHHVARALTYLGLFLVMATGLVTFFIFNDPLLLIVAGAIWFPPFIIMWLIDLFTLPGQVKSFNDFSSGAHAPGATKS